MHAYSLDRKRHTALSTFYATRRAPSPGRGYQPLLPLPLYMSTKSQDLRKIGLAGGLVGIVVGKVGGLASELNVLE